MSAILMTMGPIIHPNFIETVLVSMIVFFSLCAVFAVIMIAFCIDSEEAAFAVTACFFFVVFAAGVVFSSLAYSFL